MRDASTRFASRQRWTLLAVIVGSGMVFLDSTVVNVALPRIAAELPARRMGELEAQSYVYYGFLLALASLLVPGGALGDRWGRRRIFGAGLLGFGVTSALCGLAPTMGWLIGFRLLQGATGALLVPGSLALVRAGFSGEQQGRAFGLWASASAATTILGPLVGGVLVDGISWRAIFLLNIPFAMVGLGATYRHVEESRDETASGRFDWVGAGLLAVGVGGLVFGAIRGEQTLWTGRAAPVALALGLAGLVAAPLWMRRARPPLVPPALFRSRDFVVTGVSTLFLYGGLYVTFYYLTIYLQGTRGYTPAAAGLAGTPATIFVALLSGTFGKLAVRWGSRLFLSLGPALMGAGLLLLARLPAGGAAWRLKLGTREGLWPPADFLTDLLPAQAIFGLGLALLVAPLTTTVMAAVAPRHAGVASAVNNALARIGPQLVGAVTFVFVTQQFYGALARRVPGLDVSAPAVREAMAPLNRPSADLPPAVVQAAREASTEAFRTGIGIAAALVLLGGVVNLVGIRGPGAGRDPPPRAP